VNGRGKRLSFRWGNGRAENKKHERSAIPTLVVMNRGLGGKPKMCFHVKVIRQFSGGRGHVCLKEN